MVHAQLVAIVLAIYLVRKLGKGDGMPSAGDAGGEHVEMKDEE
jgi:hypothetical protein